MSIDPEVFDSCLALNFLPVCEWISKILMKKCNRRNRKTFDTSETRRDFGPIVIDYTKVQSKVTLKYDSWQKETLAKFGVLLGSEMAQFHGQVSKVRMSIW